MNDKEFADYLEADIETRYEIHKASYFKQYPASNIEKFHRFEVAFLKRQIEKYNTKETVEIEETEIYINQIEVLEYIQNLKIAPLDYRFLINSNFWEQEKTKLELASFQSKINNEGFLNVEVEKETVKIYNPQLAVILTSNELPAKDLDTQTETTIDSWEYLKTFVAAYKEGEQYFETTFKVSPEIMFGAGAKNYVNEIHMNFFHLQHRMNEGWVYVKKAEPLILTHKAVKEYGYYSGLVNKVEQLIIEHPRLFAAFEKCEHSMQPQQVETKTEKLKTILSEHGFFELTKVKQLSEQNKQSLIELISTADLPYSIAMFEYLAFLKHLKAEHLTTDYKLFKAISEWFNVGQRRVKGNIYVLNEISKENRKRYTADQHKQTVQNDYDKLK